MTAVPRCTQSQSTKGTEQQKGESFTYDAAHKNKLIQGYPIFRTNFLIFSKTNFTRTFCALSSTIPETFSLVQPAQSQLTTNNRICIPLGTLTGAFGPDQPSPNCQQVCFKSQQLHHSQDSGIWKLFDPPLLKYISCCYFSYWHLIQSPFIETPTEAWNTTPLDIFSCGEADNSSRGKLCSSSFIFFLSKFKRRSKQSKQTW